MKGDIGSASSLVIVIPHLYGSLELLLMLGDEPLGDGHTHWPNPEECMTVKGNQQ